MPEQWKSITGLPELEQHSSAQEAQSLNKDDLPVHNTSGTDTGVSISGNAAFSRGLLFGTVVALVGSPLYFLILFLCGFYVGFVALPVGWMVGKAIKKGSCGEGGLRYQIAAVLLTYVAVCIAYIPVLVGSFLGTYRTPDILWGMIFFMATYAPLFQFQRGAVGFIGEFLLFVGLFIAYKVTAAEM